MKALTKLQPACLRWARERIPLGTLELASKLGVAEDKVLAWEASGSITLALAEKVANATHTPLGYLFLSEPPVEELPIQDFRMSGGQRQPHPSPDLLDTVYGALRSQEWYRDYLVANGAGSLGFVGSLSVTDPVPQAAEQIRSVIGWNTDASAQARGWEAALVARIDAVEEAGVLVMRSGIVGSNTHRVLDVSDFRGFALSDDYAPIVFINTRDAIAAQAFTLAHELVHIWLDTSGVSNPSLYHTRPSDDATERFCNQVAAEMLVPLSDLKIEWNDAQGSRDCVSQLARHFKVSALVILRRLLDTDYLDHETFSQLYNDALVQFSGKRARSNGGNFYKMLCARLGERFVTALVESTLEGRTLYRDAFHLLGVAKAETIHELGRRIGAEAAA